MRKLLYLLLASFIMFSCEKERNNDLNNLIQPLEVGYSWTFIDSIFTEEGILTNVDTSTLSIVGKETVNYEGKQTELFYWKWDFFDRIWLMGNEGGNNYIYGIREDGISYLIAQSMAHPYPVNIGDTWISYTYSLQVEGDTTFGVISDTTEYKCLYKDYMLHTKVGDLKCIVSSKKKEMGAGERETLIYNSLNIGYVGLESRINNIVTFKKTLMSYDFSNKQGLSTVVKSANINNNMNIPSDTYGLKIRK